MKVLVAGVGGQLGHDVMNELHRRGYEGVDTYSGTASAQGYALKDGTPLCFSEKDQCWQCL